ncbi:bifunctional hydroxymethylpyrimidine kinase/phosphomethylpyrimidine kinase [Methylobacter sp. YRD-M1]|uniref:bifunctional hydroxymethylpyrimidine kinase/phosphomethylpyrimidine kinase n=1 Tax=Methylobacter sp. YRD-M1 TaxID=2911520 RepID=UPI003FA34BE5
MNRPVVLCFSGHDPSGGAGVQADIETLVSQQCHAASVITALTEQDTHNVKKLIPQRPVDIISQAATLLADLPVKAIKIGLIGHPDTAAAIHEILIGHPQIPVVLDPVLAAGGGAELASEKLIAAVTDLLLPCTTMLTPNSEEARRLTGLNDLHDCGLALLDEGCDYVLITGTHETSPSVSNQLFHDGRLLETFTWDRLPASYHGSGCTLASAVAGLIAQGLDPFQAAAEAQDYTWHALEAAYRPGQGQHNPNRFFWIDD